MCIVLDHNPLKRDPLMLARLPTFPPLHASDDGVQNISCFTIARQIDVVWISRKEGEIHHIQ
ncbi:hypothetical protein DID99_30580 [Burkholderia sp. Bp8986]|nr:hypothetical protein DID99_30580 [Burkholderia sp. Bp8986]